MLLSYVRHHSRRIRYLSTAASTTTSSLPDSLVPGSPLPKLTLNYEPSTNARFYLLAGGEEVSYSLFFVDNAIVNEYRHLSSL